MGPTRTCYRGAVPEGHTYRVYFDATPVRPVDEIFSFFSCQGYRKENPGLARPAIDIGGHITLSPLEGKKITRDVSLSHTTRLWQFRLPR
jgi:hypothetical protein